MFEMRFYLRIGVGLDRTDEISAGLGDLVFEILSQFDLIFRFAALVLERLLEIKERATRSLRKRIVEDRVTHFEFGDAPVDEISHPREADGGLLEGGVQKRVRPGLGLGPAVAVAEHAHEVRSAVVHYLESANNKQC